MYQILHKSDCVEGLLDEPIEYLHNVLCVMEREFEEKQENACGETPCCNSDVQCDCVVDESKQFRLVEQARNHIIKAWSLLKQANETDLFEMVPLDKDQQHPILCTYGSGRERRIS